MGRMSKFGTLLIGLLLALPVLAETVYPGQDNRDRPWHGVLDGTANDATFTALQNLTHFVGPRISELQEVYFSCDAGGEFPLGSNTAGDGSKQKPYRSLQMLKHAFSNNGPPFHAILDYGDPWITDGVEATEDCWFVDPGDLVQSFSEDDNDEPYGAAACEGSGDPFACCTAKDTGAGCTGPSPGYAQGTISSNVYTNDPDRFNILISGSDFTGANRAVIDCSNMIHMAAMFNNSGVHGGWFAFQNLILQNCPDPDIATATFESDETACTAKDTPFSCCLGLNDGVCTLNQGGAPFASRMILLNVSVGNDGNQMCVGADDPFDCCSGTEAGSCDTSGTRWGGNGALQLADAQSAITINTSFIGEDDGWDGNDTCVDIDDPDPCCIGSGTGFCNGTPVVKSTGAVNLLDINGRWIQRDTDSEAGLGILDMSLGAGTSNIFLIGTRIENIGDSTSTSKRYGIHLYPSADGVIANLNLIRTEIKGAQLLNVAPYTSSGVYIHTDQFFSWGATFNLDFLRPTFGYNNRDIWIDELKANDYVNVDAACMANDLAVQSSIGGVGNLGLKFIIGEAVTEANVDIQIYNSYVDEDDGSLTPFALWYDNTSGTVHQDTDTFWAAMPSTWTFYNDDDGVSKRVLGCSAADTPYPCCTGDELGTCGSQIGNSGKSLSQFLGGGVPAPLNNTERGTRKCRGEATNDQACFEACTTMKTYTLPFNFPTDALGVTFSRWTFDGNGQSMGF